MALLVRILKENCELFAKIIHLLPLPVLSRKISLSNELASGANSESTDEKLKDFPENQLNGVTRLKFAVQLWRQRKKIRGKMLPV